MKWMLLFLLGMRLVFLSVAGSFCIFGLLHAGEPQVAWYWTAGHIIVLAISGFLIGKVWTSLKVAWQQK